MVRFVTNQPKRKLTYNSVRMKCNILHGTCYKKLEFDRCINQRLEIVIRGSVWVSDMSNL